MLNVAIYGMGNWGSRLIESVQGKSDKIKFVCGIHTLDSMINLGGLVSEVYAHSARRTLQAQIDMDDTTSMLLKFKSGITGYFATIFVTGELWRVLIFRITPRSSCWRTPARHPRSNLPGLPARCESELPGHRRARLSPYAAARYSAP